MGCVPRGDAGTEGARTTHSEDATRAAGRELAGHLGAGDVVLLFGELGTGKTCFVRGVAEGLGVDPERVHSPTFVMVHRYEGRLTVNHVDLYRVAPGESIADLALPDHFGGDGVTLVEWAEHLPEAGRPRPRLEVHLEHLGHDARRLRTVLIPR